MGSVCLFLYFISDMLWLPRSLLLTFSVWFWIVICIRLCVMWAAYTPTQSHIYTIHLCVNIFCIRSQFANAVTFNVQWIPFLWLWLWLCIYNFSLCAFLFFVSLLANCSFPSTLFSPAHSLSLSYSFPLFHPFSTDRIFCFSLRHSCGSFASI